MNAFVQRESQGVCKAVLSFTTFLTIYFVQRPEGLCSKAVRKTCTDFCGNHRRKNAEIEVFLNFFAKILAYVQKKQ